MKVYLYYMNDNAPGWGDCLSFYSSYRDDEHNNLYAFTNKKKRAKVFENQRKMDLFFKKVIDINDAEYSNLANEYRGSLLEYFSFITKDIRTGLYTIKYVDILCTMNEYQNSAEDNSDLYIYEEGFWYSAPDPAILKSELKDALSYLDYNISYMLFNPKNNPLYDNIIDSDQYASPDSRVDELSLFVKLYNNTFA